MQVIEDLNLIRRWLNAQDLASVIYRPTLISRKRIMRSFTLRRFRLNTLQQLRPIVRWPFVPVLIR